MRSLSRPAAAFVLLSFPAVVAGQVPPPTAHGAAPPSGLPADIKERPIGLEALRRAEKLYARMLDAATDKPAEWQLPRYVGHHLKTLRALVALERGQVETAEAILLQVADEFAAQPGIDAWSSGLVHLDRVAGLARRAGRDRLAASVEERIRRIDPEASVSRGVLRRTPLNPPLGAPN